MTHFTKLTYILVLLLTFYSCSGGGSGNDGILSESEAKLVRPPVSSSLNLRLGQTSSSSSPVAVSAALENGESITIFSQQVGEVTEFSVVYINADGLPLKVTFDPSGRPTTAETNDAVISFSNYSDTTVDISITTLDGSGSRVLRQTTELPAQPLDQSSVTFLEGDTLLEILLGINKDVDSGTRSLLTFAFSSLRVVGCIANDVASKLSSFGTFVPGVFQTVGNNACGSTLLETINTVIASSDYEEITVTDIDVLNTCEISQSLGDFVSCAQDFGGKTVEAAKAGIVGEISQLEPEPSPSVSPSPGQSGSPNPSPSTSPSANASPTSSPSHSPSTSPSVSPSASSSPAPLGDPRRGTWSGIGTPNMQFTSCNQYNIDFTVSDAGDIDCISPLCDVVGTVTEISMFPDFTVTGTMDGAGNLFISGTDSSFIFTGMGILTMGTSTGSFDVSGLPMCDGIITVTQTSGPP